ncbi:hypothetical protein Cantr_09020 [Candida viswanathii]|uniref:Uncharacterized protein n=1 Tax=Candida viswanathii TaxID=5486 RepID=A0A367Y9L8_9ASCO|nr:hypothetical protein Cantr_09020 [Candida viswanathii]
MSSHLLKRITPRLHSIPYATLDYFRNSVGFSFRLSPVPTSPDDLDYIHNALNNLAPIDVFKTLYRKEAGFFVNMIFSPCRDETWYGLLSKHSPDPLQYESDTSGESPETPTIIDSLAPEVATKYTKSKKELLIANLDKIIAIPRYEYIKGNKEFAEDKVELQFKHGLGSPTFKGRYSFTYATGSEPIIYCYFGPGEKPIENLQSLRRDIRHNFTMFYKFDQLTITPEVDFKFLKGHINI